MTAPLNRQPNQTFAKAFACMALLLSLGCTSYGQSLNWDNEYQFFEAGFDDEEIVASYQFTNVGQETVEIIETKTSCGCTVPKLEKKVYEPGESGVLTAIFTIGSRQGKNSKKISVLTAEETYELTMEIDIPIPVTLSPRVQFWKVSEALTPKQIEVKFHEQKPIKLTHLERKSDAEVADFEYSIETITEGLNYIVTIVPKSTERKTRIVYFLASGEAEQEEELRKYPIYCFIR